MSERERAGITVEDVHDDARRVHVVRHARVVAGVDALRPLDDERARRGVAHHLHPRRALVVDHALVLVPEHEVRRHAALAQVAREPQRAPALHVLLRAALDLRVRLCVTQKQARQSTSFRQRLVNLSAPAGFALVPNRPASAESNQI